MTRATCTVVGRHSVVHTRSTRVGRHSVVDARSSTHVGRHAVQRVSRIHAKAEASDEASSETADNVVEKAEAAEKPAEKVSNWIGFLPGGPTITIEDIIEAQKMWGDAVVTIGKAGEEKAKTLADETARTAYAFDLGPIMFKPTLASDIPFRQDIEGTVSYFVGGNSRFPEDQGFARKPWTNVRFVNDTVKIQGNFAIAMGHYYFTDVDGKDTKAEYTKGYVKTPDDRVLIFLQDSSLPYSPS